MGTTVARVLIGLATILSLGHHLDHVVRGNHTGWPVTDQVTAFTYSLAVYPLILLGLYLSRSEKVATAYWIVFSGLGVLFLGAIHLGPTALEPPADIIGQYSSPLIGRLAFAWMLGLVAVLLALFAWEIHRWRRLRHSSPPRRTSAP